MPIISWVEKDDWGDAAKVITQLWRELQDARVPEVDYALLADHANNAKMEPSIRKYLALTLVEKSLAARDVSQALTDLEKYRRSINEHDTELLANVGMVKLQFVKDLAAVEEILAQLRARASQGDLLAAAEMRLFSIMIDRYRKRLDGLQLPRPANHSSALATAAKISSQMGNYPNPFNPETTIRFHVFERQKVRLVIYDLTGHRVRTLLESELPAGEQTISWNGRDQKGRSVASGVYFYELLVGNKVERRKMTLIR